MIITNQTEIDLKVVVVEMYKIQSLFKDDIVSKTAFY